MRPTIARLGGALAGMALVFSLAACGDDDDNGSTGDNGDSDVTSVKIGFMGDLTGENAAIVIPPHNGAKLAIEQYNETGPDVEIELVDYDSQGKEEQAVGLAQQAMQDGIVGLIGPAFSGESKAVGPILEQGKIPSVSASATNPALADNGWEYWHRLVANDDDQGPATVEFLVRALEPATAFVLSDDQEYSVGLAEAVAGAFEEQGVEIETDRFERNESDYSSVVSKVAAAEPDVIYFGGYYQQGGRLLKQLRDGGVEAPFATGDGSLDAQLISGAGEAAAEGAVVTCPCNIAAYSEEGSELATFAEDFEAFVGEPAGIYATEGYDAATAFIEAVKAGNTDTESINEFLGTVDIPGASKQIKFKDNGEPETTDIFVYYVQGGQLTALGPAAEATLPE